MIITTNDEIPNNKVVEIVGIISGSCVQSTHVGKDILASIRNIFGGELVEYSKIVDRAYEVAYNRLIENAKLLNCDAIVTVRITTTQTTVRGAEFLIYGTGVKIKSE